jgi:D-aminoacyl-tRNA deacylase
LAFRRKSGFVLAASNTDPAGITLGQSLISEGRFELAEETAGSGKIFTSGLYDNAILYTSNKSVLFMDDLDELFPLAEAFLFLSKHKSDSAIPTLTCHSVGNFSDNPYGGKPRELGIAFPSMQKKYMQTIFNGRSKVPGYDIVIEATHHGPTSLKKPAIFIELGSSEPQWVDAKLRQSRDRVRRDALSVKIQQAASRKRHRACRGGFKAQPGINRRGHGGTDDRAELRAGDSCSG